MKTNGRILSYKAKTFLPLRQRSIAPCSTEAAESAALLTISKLTCTLEGHILSVFVKSQGLATTGRRKCNGGAPEDTLKGLSLASLQGGTERPLRSAISHQPLLLSDRLLPVEMGADQRVPRRRRLVSRALSPSAAVLLVAAAGRRR